MSGKSLGCCVLLALAAFAHAEMATRRWGTPPRSAPVKAKRAKPPTGYAAETKDPPKIDGDLADACWATARPLVIAQTLDGGGRASQPTEVRLVHDRQNLYIAFKAAEPFVNKLQGSRRAHDGEFWNDDSVEVFLAPANAGGYFHFGITAFGSTYDGRVKDGSWNSGMTAAAAKGKGEWTAEAAIPLEKLAGKGAPPVRWIANFNRNRYTQGRWEEFAWSPTYSGDSHVPSRFGELLFQEPPREEEQGAGEAPRSAVGGQQSAVEIQKAEGGEGIVRFDLADLKGAKVLRADLLIFRTAEINGSNDEAMVDIEIYPLDGGTGAGGTGVPPVGAKPLELREPWFDRFDATEAVRAACRVPREERVSFFVKACPLWRADATCLEVAYEGKPANPPPPAKGVKAFHRAGQTFITWGEIEDLVGKDEAAWGTLKALLDNLDRDREVRYCVYRGERPITAASLPQAELLATVKPLSGWNLNGRNIDQPIDRVIATQEVLMCGHWSPFRDASVDGDFGRDCAMRRLVVREGEPPLPRATGLYVHAATKEAAAYYAVVTSVDGVQSTAEIVSAGPVKESPAEPEPVLQGELPKMPFFNYPEKRLHYVRWVAPPYCNLPSQYYNWSVGVPERPPEGGTPNGVPVELSLHRDGHSYWRTQYRIERDSIVLSPHDFPLLTWWHGYHESCGTLRSFRHGAIQPYTERRLLSFINWAAKKWPADRNRILVTGCRGGAAGSGALHLGIRHPEVFSLVIAGHPTVDYAAASRATDRWGLPLALSMQAVWGKADWDLKTDEGKSFWAEHNLVEVAKALPPAADLPFITMTSSNGYAECRRFYEAMLNGRRGIMAEFSWGGARYVPVSDTGTYPNVIRLDIRRDRPLFAFTSAGGLGLVTEGKMGDFNLQFRWRDVADAPDRFEATLFLQGRGDAVADVCPRRLQRFKVEKGKAYAWTCGAQSGEATVGDDGLLVLKGVKLTPEGNRLAVKAK